MPEYVRVCQSMPEYARVCQSMPEYARVCLSKPEYAKLCQSMPEYARVCQSIPDYARFCTGFLNPSVPQCEKNTLWPYVIHGIITEMCDIIIYKRGTAGERTFTAGERTWESSVQTARCHFSWSRSQPKMLETLRKHSPMMASVDSRAFLKKLQQCPWSGPKRPPKRAETARFHFSWSRSQQKCSKLSKNILQ